MNIFRQLNFCRIVITLLLLVGLLPQMRTVFACELIEGVLQFSCCCDEPGEMSCDKSGDCDNNAPALATLVLENNCCDIFYQAVSTSISANTYDIQTSLSKVKDRVKSLNASQPPPGVIFNHSLADLTSATKNIAYTVFSDIQSATAGKSTYLHTLRLRL